MLKAHLGHLLPGPGTSCFSLLLALENDARQQDLRLECWSLQSLTSNRADALVQVPTRACVLGVRRHWKLCACTRDRSLHSGDPRIWRSQSCDIMVMVCMGKERKPRQSMASLRGCRQMRGEAHPALRAAVGCSPCRGLPLDVSPYLHLTSLLAT